MARINLTLDHDTYTELEEHARRVRKPRARVVKELLIEGLSRYKARARRQRLARDYAAGRADARKMLDHLESGQLELLGDEDA
jgi:metal-responsive CopG/Arc/MetJ family transcriptional regulator